MMDYLNEQNELDRSNVESIINGMDSTEDVQPRKKRGGTAPSGGFVLTEDDVEILTLVFSHRFLRRGQVSILTHRHPKRLHRRLLKLEQRGYLTTVRMPQQEYIYGLGRSGIQILVEQGRAEPDLLDGRVRTHELTELFLRHEMMLVDIHVKLSLALEKHPVRLVAWKEGSELHDSVVAVDKMGSSRLPVRPDAFFTLYDRRRHEGANRANFALEADRSTTTQVRFQEKLRAYWAYIEQGRHEKKFGVKGFRVLTVTLTEARAKNLTTMAASVLPERGRKYFLFVPQSSFSATSDPVSDRLCFSPRTAVNELHALVPAPNELRKEDMA